MWLGPATKQAAGARSSKQPDDQNDQDCARVGVSGGWADVKCSSSYDCWCSAVAPYEALSSVDDGARPWRGQDGNKSNTYRPYYQRTTARTPGAAAASSASARRIPSQKPSIRVAHVSASAADDSSSRPSPSCAPAARARAPSGPCPRAHLHAPPPF